jgi:hypothetical protein
MTTVDCWQAAADRHGLLTTSDALAAGLTKRDLDRMAENA